MSITTPTTELDGVDDAAAAYRRLGSAVDDATDRVAELVAGVRPTRVLLTVLAAPLYLAGALVALVWVALVWLAMAAVVGWRDVNGRLRSAVEDAE